MNCGVFHGLALAALLAAATARGQVGPAEEIVVCGWDEVFVARVVGGRAQRSWSWRAKGRADLPAEFHGLFNSTDECKPFDGGARILITSSGGAAALVDRRTDRVLFYGRAANAHSADLLPNGRVAVAASHDRGANKGDRLILFDAARSNHELWSGELPWGHGVIWDERRKRLWALADADIRVFELQDWETASPKLRRVALIPLPEGGGHDFTVVDDARIALSTANRVWLFDRDTHAFLPHPELADKAKIKSVQHHPETGRIVYVQAEGENWWAERIHFLRPGATLHVPGEHFYKARWNPPAR